MIRKLANAVGYYVVWFASVAGAGRGLAYAGPLAATMFIAMVLAFGGKRHADVRLIAISLAIGAVADSAWIALGWLDFNAAWPSTAFAPAWILGLWCSLAATLNHSLAFLKHRYALAALLGAIGGPLSYWSAAHALGAVHLDAPAMTVMSGLCIAWAVVFPVLVRIAEEPAMPSSIPSKPGEAHS